jgi:DNA sulfur modification protein DndD
MLKLKKLSMTNFMPYKGLAVMKFPTDETRNTLIVFGDNMRGKTSLLNAIRWCFYGKAMGRHLRQIPLHLMPNREATAEDDWKMEVKLEFEAEGSSYELIRSAVKRDYVAKPERPEDYICELHLKKDEAAIPASNIDFEINKFSPESVSRFFLFDGELLQEYEELLIEGSEQGKLIKDAIEQALGVPALTNGKEHLYHLLKKAQKVQEGEAAKIKGLEGLAERQKSLRVKRDSLENDLIELKDKHNKIKTERLEIEDELSKSESILKQKAQFDALTSTVRDLESQIKIKNVSRLELASHVWRDLLVPRLLAKREVLQAEQSRLLEKMNERIKIQTLIDQKNSFLSNSICPSCKAPMDSKKLEQHQNELKHYISDLELITDGSEALSVTSAKLQGINKLI